MSSGFVPVQWNRKKFVYDGFVVAGVVLYTQLFMHFGRAALQQGEAITPQILGMRAWGSCAFLMVTLILCIGPLARLDRRFLPILFNRRHFGVIAFGVATWHAYQVLSYYQAYGRLQKLDALLAYDNAFTGSSVPFQFFGVGALLIFGVMALSSHDFWQRALGPSLWKWIHMGVYLAYALVVAHVFFGELQWERHPTFATFFAGAPAIVVGLHLMAAWVSRHPDQATPLWVEMGGKRWLRAGRPTDIPLDAAKPLAVPGGERIALVRSGAQVSAIHGVCAHQGGPLYEGRVIDGCLTCPWHGWQYRASDGTSPPPFTERLPTYEVALHGGELVVNPIPLPPGTPTTPVQLDAGEP